ncbi:hypothetical protein [Cellulomonas xiejunii]|uniref:hypothetical protein n=1 Tax=Cellulomonas xiejunii TaxID=2968083 RepID=UPI001D0E1CB4|nr:hypothetical protein [Cellulomonas xiejunii]MCC2314576.1 hypothetical protein [Cellulomonas xiejunii]
MPETPSHRSTGSRPVLRRRGAAVAVAVLAAALVGGGVALADRKTPADDGRTAVPAAGAGAVAASPGADVDATPGAEAEASQPPHDGLGVVGSDVVADSVQAALAAAGVALAAPEAAGDELATVATGDHLASLRADVEQFAAEGLTQAGQARVEAVEVVEQDVTATPPTVTARLCIDSSEVQVLDENGTNLRGAGTPPRSLNVIRLVEEDGTWKVAHQAFADDPAC